MSIILLIIVLIVFWQPLYFLGMMGYYKFNSDASKVNLYQGMITDWFKKLFSLVFGGSTSG